MTSKNTMTLHDLAGSSPGTLDDLPIHVLADLKQQADAHLASASQMVAVLHGVFTRRYATGLNGAGASNRTDGQYDIKITVPKTVSWNEDALLCAIETINSWGECPEDYIETKYSIAESKYKAWPPAIRDLFTPARTVKTGKPRFDIVLAKEKAA